MLVLILGRFVNVAVPFLFANLVFIFGEGATSPPWLYLSGYAGLRFLQSGGGLPALVEVSDPCFLIYVSSESVYPVSLDPRDAILG